MALVVVVPPEAVAEVEVAEVAAATQEEAEVSPKSTLPSKANTKKAVAVTSSNNTLILTIMKQELTTGMNTMARSTIKKTCTLIKNSRLQLSINPNNNLNQPIAKW